MKRIVPVVVFWATLVLAGCASAPTRFYTLEAAAGDASPVLHAGYRIDVLPVTIPAQVDQPQLVVRLGDDQLALLDSERWIGPLGDQIQAVLSENLTRRLGAEDVSGLPGMHDKPTYRIKLDVRRFDSMPGHYALITAGWSVRAVGGTQRLTCSATVKRPVAAGYAALVRGHQQALAQLADAIATSVQRLAQGRGSCP